MWRLTQKAELNWERDQLRAYRRRLGTLLTDPDAVKDTSPFTGKKYLLRGVATAQDVMYVCQRAEPQLIELDDTPQPIDQWWRLAFVPDDDEPVKTEASNNQNTFSQTTVH